ncbi:MAG: hypothetical protein ACOCPT_05915, partial [Halanaeroarchaeum sp.]
DNGSEASAGDGSNRTNDDNGSEASAGDGSNRTNDDGGPDASGQQSSADEGTDARSGPNTSTADPPKSDRPGFDYSSALEFVLGFLG